MTIVDSFLFGYELDLLEARLEYLYPVVDYFYLAESSVDHVGNSKQLIFFENQHRFTRFADKIRRVEIKPESISNYCEPVFGIQNQITSRVISTSRTVLGEAVARDFPDGQMIYSDLDEIVDRRLLEQLSKGGLSLLEGDLYYYYCNNKCITFPYTRLPWVLYMPTKFISKTKTLTSFRNILFQIQARYLGQAERNQNAIFSNPNEYFDREIVPSIEGEFNLKIVKNGAYHFSYLGGPEEVAKKLVSAGHTELIDDLISSPDHINECVNSGRDLYKRDINFLMNSESFIDPALQSLLSKFCK